MIMRFIIKPKILQYKNKHFIEKKYMDKQIIYVKLKKKNNHIV